MSEKVNNIELLNKIHSSIQLKDKDTINIGSDSENND